MTPLMWLMPINSACSWKSTIFPIYLQAPLKYFLNEINPHQNISPCKKFQAWKLTYSCPQKCCIPNNKIENNSMKIMKLFSFLPEVEKGS